MSCCTIQQKQKFAQAAFYFTLFSVGGLSQLITSGVIAARKMADFCDEDLHICQDYMSGGDDRVAALKMVTNIVFFGFGGVISVFFTLASVFLLTRLHIIKKMCLPNSSASLSEESVLSSSASKSCLSKTKTFLIPNKHAAIDLASAFFSVLILGLSITSLAAFGLTSMVTSPDHFFFSSNDTASIEKLGELSYDMTWTIFAVCVITTVISSSLVALTAQVLNAYFQQRSFWSHQQIDDASVSSEGSDPFSL